MKTRLRIRSPGLITTVQDSGRLAYQHVGVPVSGVLDALSFRIANALVQNDKNASVLETIIAGAEVEAVDGPVRFALAGGASDATILGESARAAPGLRSATLQPGEKLRIGAIRGASCAYLAVEGGFAIEPVLGSRSTYARGGIGGFHGRPLQAGDEIPLVLAAPTKRAELVLPEEPDYGAGSVRIVMGPQENYFTEEACRILVESDFTVSKDADRVGMRLEGPKIEHLGQFEMPSDGTVTGNIQIPGSGNPIILLPDRSTTGGYPKIATIVSSDLPRVSRMLPGQKIRFTAISSTEAVAYTRARHQYLEKLLALVRPAIRTEIDSAELLAINLIDGVVSANADN